MKTISRIDLRNKLARNEIARVYLLFGAESYLRNLAAKAIAEKALAETGINEFNYENLSLGETALSGVLQHARQPSMMSDKRVLRVSDVHRLVEDDEVALKSYLENPSTSSILIFLAGDLDKRRRISKLLLEKSVAVEFSPLGDSELLDWGRRELKQLGSVCDERVLTEIAELTGNNASRFTNELRKLSTAVYPDKVITSEVVQSLVPSSNKLDNFKLADSLVQKSRRTALKLLKKIFDDGEEAPVILGMIGMTFHRLYRVKALMKNGASDAEVSRTINVKFGLQPSFLSAARRADESFLARALNRIAETDVAIKTSRGEPRILVEVLVIELTA